MNGAEKLLAIIAVCIASVVIGIAGSMAYYNVATERAAIEAGLVQKYMVNRVIWTKPSATRRTAAEIERDKALAAE